MAITNGVSDHLEVIPLLIDGKPRVSESSSRFAVFGLEAGRDVFLAESADAKLATEAADASWLTFQTWKETPAVVRRKILLSYANLLREYEEDLVRVQQLETSIIEVMARKNVHLTADLIEELASCVTRIEGTIPPIQTKNCIALALPQPVGPVLSIAPWNSSVILGARSISTPVAAGCTVVFKASELCPKTHHMLVKIFEKAGLPAGVINVLQARREDAAAVTEAIISHQAIRKVEFVGSAGVGRSIGSLAGKHLKPVLMELGGKGPAIVLEDADLEEAANKCITGAFMHHGQWCFSTERVIVLDSVAEEFSEILKRKAANFISGGGVSERMVNAALDKLVDAQSKGAKFIVGGPERLNKSTLRPTIVTGVTKDMFISDEESFGPSFALYTAKTEEEAIEIANSTKYGLNAAIHSADLMRALNMAKKIDTAQVHVNNMTAHDEPTIPIGGVKASGWGRNNALWGIREFTDIKVVTLSSKGSDFL